MEGAVSKIGNLPFNEKRLVLSERSDFEAILETPSSRAKTFQGSLNSAAIHLIDILLLQGQNCDHSSSSALAKYIVQTILQPIPLRHRQLSALRSLTRSLSPKTALRPLQLILWQEFAMCTSSALQLPRTVESPGGSYQTPGHEYRDVVKILESGVQQHSMDIFPIWQQLYNQLDKTIEKEIGSVGATTMVAWPLLAMLRNEIENQFDILAINAVLSIFEKISWPRSRQTLERTHIQIWGTVHASHKSFILDPIEDLYLLVDAMLLKAYANIERLPIDLESSLITAVVAIMHACPPGLRAGLLANIQRGLGAWIEDTRGALSGAMRDIYPQVSGP